VPAPRTPMTSCPSPTIRRAFSAGGRAATLRMLVVCLSLSFPRYGWPGMHVQSSGGIHVGLSTIWGRCQSTEIA
jgi:hypothetical protein